MAIPRLQQQMPTPGGVGNEFQSIRSSCERCRFQKLKCTLPDGSDGRGPCQRCARAKVECVFGRRRRASRISGPKKRVETTSFNKAILASPETPTTSTGLPCLTLAGPDIEPPVESAMYNVLDWNIIQLQDATDKAMDLANDISSYDLQYRNGLDDTFLFDTDQLYSSRCSPPEQSQSQPVEVMTGSSSDSSGMVQQLLALLLEIQQRLKMLKEGPWQFGSIYGLDNYPIGTILHLTQEFIVAVGPILGGASEPLNENTSTSSSSSDGTVVDDLAAVLVLSGYMSLMRIYSIVFGHFQTHLSQMPSHSQSLASSTTSPTLQLSELPCVNTAHELGRIHMALCMLQGSLKDVEGQLGIGGVVARDMVMAQLRKEAMLSSGNLKDGGSGVSRQATAVKEILREKMSL
ncbi:hypothetical protein K469DRAFT_683363 [Zopfia rhizophila CBS 207.26]|uniref:Zn(2)-C6 fungal-type domain-containing protein n=1 Tax=Zopfia rhizophila CBS 207.26 TaxID=1314779 RepID=A0A6A6DA23_9PEZI|nr:hypothetical protein K469DRAFT_683363 [Zopfia rhizophila CBS 207.26]